MFKTFKDKMMLVQQVHVNKSYEIPRKCKMLQSVSTINYL